VATAALRVAPPIIRLAPVSDSRPVSARMAQVLAEILAGARPASQLTDTAAPEVLRLLTRNAGRLSAFPGAVARRPIVDSVHVREPCAGVAEACAVVNLGPRCRAIAFRLERSGHRWHCTAVHIG
jgi:hypothetical protein